MAQTYHRVTCNTTGFISPTHSKGLCTMYHGPLRPLFNKWPRHASPTIILSREEDHKGITSYILTVPETHGLTHKGLR